MRKLVCFLLLGALSAVGLDRQPNADYRARRVALAAKASDGVVVLFAATESEGPNALSGFKQNANFFYLTGWNEPGAALVIAPAAPAKDGRPARAYEEILFLPNHNFSQEHWTGPKLGPEDPQAPAITGVDRVLVLDKLRDELVRILPSPRSTVYTDLGGHAAAAPLVWLARANAFPNYNTFVDVKPLIAALRLVKDAGELARIQRATDATMAAHLAAMRAIKPGITEREISALMQYEFEKRGCERPAYAPVVGSGFNGTVLHYAENSGTARDGEVIVMDVGGEYAMYASDITRTVPVNGKFTARQRELYNIVLGAQQAAIDAFQRGKHVINPLAENSLYKVAYDYINTHGKDLHGKPLGQYFIHGLSHYIGLQVHDVGDTNTPLDTGMVFSVEPGIYIPEEKIGIRIEDLVRVDASGKLVRLSESLPRTAEEIEKVMAGK
ncbi:MAG: aminopeptidase P N-terminal domain-containing protein [Terriglobales bacterium]